MGRSPCCSKEGLNRGAWTAREDDILISYINTHGEGRWTNLPREAGLKRCGKSCRLRWLNYLRPNIKRGNISDDEEELIIRLHKLLGNRWSLIAGRLPGRTDNEIKNYWNTTLGKKVQHSNSSRLPNQKQLNQSTRKLEKAIIEPNPAVKNEEKQTPPKVETHVIRTKARRCHKVFLSPPQHNHEDLCRSGHRNGAQNPCHMQSHSRRPSSLATREEDDSIHSLDFDISGMVMMELLDSDILQPYADDENNSSHNKYGIDNMYSMEQTQFYPETMLKEWTADECLQSNIAAELQLFDSYLKPEEEWF